jgi:hypothetical protein
VIELPGIKDPGDTPYEDERIHPNTLDFLRDLKKNNRREWLKFHDAPYRSVTPSNSIWFWLGVMGLSWPVQFEATCADH